MMVPACGAFRGWAWSDLAMTQVSGGFMGAAPDDILVYQDPTGFNGDQAYIQNANNQTPVSMNNIGLVNATDAQGDAERALYIYAYPNGPADRAGQFICSATGWRAPGRFRVCVDGRFYIKGYEPKKGKNFNQLELGS